MNEDRNSEVEILFLRIEVIKDIQYGKGINVIYVLKIHHHLWILALFHT